MQRIDTQIKVIVSENPELSQIFFSKTNVGQNIALHILSACNNSANIFKEISDLKQTKIKQMSEWASETKPILF